ncbi:phage tail family protein [Neobacillus sp. MM2021_6]|uniref:distal tail protein Dit n=1 Tax=Bacillaceae TaxID=186817 RepID=UPI00140DEFA5|nr:MULTISPECIES: distal tail protein Dit [Bacillaceae]MBO0962491.1 phage tail family protein [Neobacillus sp. MM2021_6]NHC21280.1 phage tail family protein [Bacillus sp. MM2020_4]
MRSFTFNGIHKDYVTASKIKRPSWAEIQRNTLTFPGLPGGLLQDTIIKPKIIPVTLFVKNQSFPDLLKLGEDLAEWLITDQSTELIFDDESDRVYYAIVDGSFDPERIANTGQGTITFICLDPYKYGREKTVNILNGMATIANTGTVETPPTFALNVIKPTTFIDVVTDDAYMRLGQIPGTDDAVFQPVTTLLNDGMASTVGWAKSIFAPDVGVIASDGTIMSDGADFLPGSYGTGSLWYGPAVAKSLSSQVTDYLFRFRVQHEVTDIASFGRTNLFLLDVNNKPIARLSLVKDTTGELSTPEIRLLGANGETQYVLRLTRDQVQNWKDAYVFLELKREGNTFTARVARTRGYGGRVEEEVSQKFVDTAGIFIRSVASVAVNFMKYGNSPTLNRNRVQETLVQRINQQTGIPYIVQLGDVVEIDHKTNDIRINGETRLIKTFGSSFFNLKKGANNIMVQPADAVTAKVTWRERFK